jgi:membrane protein
VLASASAIFGQDVAREKVKELVESNVGPTVAKSIQELLNHASDPGKGYVALTIGIGALLIGASAVFAELQNALNVIWQLAPKPDRGFMGMIRDRLLSIGLVLSTCFVLITSLIVSAMLTYFSTFWTPSSMPGGAIFWQLVNQIATFMVTMALFAMIYKWVPDAVTHWHDILVGAAITALLFNVGKYFLGLYLGSSAFGSAYAAAGSLAALLVWVYYSAQIFLFGAAFTRAYSECCGRRVPMRGVSRDRDEQLRQFPSGTLPGLTNRP